MAVFLYICSFCLILTVHEAFSQSACAPHDVVDYLNLTNNEKFVTSRPVRDWKHPTEVYLDVYLSAILSVVEKSQIFVSCLWLSTTWHNELISWNPEEFCGITKVSLPREMLWKPDISIYELAEKENGPPSSYLYITYYGDVTMEDVLTVVTTCSMDVYKFPFDTQSCHMTISSMLHSNSEIKLSASSNSTRITQQSRKILMTQGEWDLLSMTVTGENMTFEPGTWDIIKYTITIRRKPLLHILTFHVPVLFFLMLDLASFFIPDNKGDKISFKVTILLAISVLLLILNGILPSKSIRCPLIATYTIFIFAFMMVSLLETILVAYLSEMDSAGEEGESVNPHTSEKDEKRRRGSNNHTSSGVNSPSESLVGVGVGGAGAMDGVGLGGAGAMDGVGLGGAGAMDGVGLGGAGAMDGVGLGGAGAMADLHLLQLMVQQFQVLRENPRSPSPRAQRLYGRAAKRIHTAFLVFYFCSSFLFLIIISVAWMH